MDFFNMLYVYNTQNLMRNPLVQSDLTLVQPNSSYLTKHVCFETWSLTLPSLFWWNLMKNKSQLFRHLNIPLKSIFREEFNGIFRFSIHSAKLELFHKTYISFFLFLQPKWFPKWTRRKLIFFNFSLGDWKQTHILPWFL